jgi:hypothetical protein
MAQIELTRQEIWTILCWAGDEGDSDRMPQFYNEEEASVLRKLRTALAEETARIMARADALRQQNQPAGDPSSSPS